MRDHGMFDFLMNEGPKNTVGLDLIQEFAKEAAQAFLGKDSAPLNYTIQKTAKAHGLTPDSISLLCQESNKAVHQVLFKTAEDKYVDFEIADPNVIVSNLEQSISKTAGLRQDHLSPFYKKSELEKTANIGVTGSDDYAFAPGERKAYFGDFQMTKNAGHSGLGDNKKTQDNKNYLTKKAALSDLNDERLILSGQIQSAEKNFVKTARNALMAYPLHERVGHFSDLAMFCKSAGLSNEKTAYLLKMTSEVMKRQGILEKSADIKVDESLISDKLDARVINGQHPLLILINTLADKWQRSRDLDNRHNLIQTELHDCGSPRSYGAIRDQEVKEL